MKNLTRNTSIAMCQSLAHRPAEHAFSGTKTQLQNGLRVLTAICLAPVITFGLLMLMNALIDGHLPEPEPTQKILLTGIFDIPKTKPVPPPERPEELDEVMPPPDLENDWVIEGGDELALRSLGVGIGPSPTFDPTLVDSDSPIRLVAVAPVYPQSAITREVEGYVDIRFDITKAGTTENLEIIAYEPSTIFNRAVMRAVARWRYQPVLSKGEPVPTRGVMERVSFEMEK